MTVDDASTSFEQFTGGQQTHARGSVDDPGDVVHTTGVEESSIRTVEIGTEPLGTELVGSGPSSGDGAAVRSLVARIPPGTSTGWHRHDAWQTGIVASGRLRHRTAETERFFGPGDVLVEPPMVDHEASNVSDEELVLVFVAVHAPGKPLATSRPAP